MASSLSTTTYRLPLPSFPSKNGGRNHFSSSLFCNSSTSSLSSNPNLCLQFQKARQNLVITSTPRPLTIISMAPPKPGGKAKKGSPKFYSIFICISSWWCEFIYLFTLCLVNCSCIAISRSNIWFNLSSTFFC